MKKEKNPPGDGFPERKGKGRVTPGGLAITKITEEEEREALNLDPKDLIPAKEFIKKLKGP